MKSSIIEEFSSIRDEVEIQPIETALDDSSGTVYHREARIIERDLFNLRFTGQFMFGGKYYRMTYKPNLLAAMSGAEPRYQGRCFYQEASFTHHIFDSLDDARIGRLVRNVYQEFYKNIKNWQKETEG